MREFGLMHGLTGGATGNLDAVLSTDVTDYSVIFTEDTGVVYAHYYNSASALAESSPNVIKPDNLGVGDAGRWLLLDVWTGLAALDAIGALTPAANKIPHYTSASAATALEITEQTLLGRITGGNIAALTAAQIRTLLGTAPFVLGSDADGDTYHRASGVLARLAKGAANLKMYMNAGATAPEWASGLKIGSFTRAMTAASGDVAITSVGFKPTVVIFFGAINATRIVQHFGISDATNHYSIYDNSSTESTSSSYCLSFLESGPKAQQGIIKSMDADGFTITWTLTGSPASQIADIFYIALR